MKKYWLIAILFAAIYTANAQRPRIELKGIWNTQLGDCRLPGTTDESKLGDGKHPTDVTYQLTRLFPYSGKVIYTKEVTIPATMSGKRLALVMERTKPSTLWIDGDSIGSLGHIYASHIYELPQLSAGKHTISIRVDNSHTSVPREIQSSHAWTDGTQTNWNGILGDFYIEARESAFIQSVQVYHNVAEKTVRVVAVVDAAQACKGMFELTASAWNTDKQHTVTANPLEVNLAKGLNTVETTVDMGNNVLLWSEFHPALYKAECRLVAASATDRYSFNFGMRHFTTEGTQFVMNGKKTFLRGKHDSNVFPLTGYAPMDVASWQRVFQIAKSYGINYYRCHSYTPPRAAFEAADIEGIYFQPELPLWGRISRENTNLNAFLLREARQLLDYMGNHPSFMMFSLGNELNGEIEVMREWVNSFKQQDPRHLYSFGSNNNLGWAGPQDGEDYFTTCRVGGGAGYSTHVRTSFAFVDAEKGGILNNTYPSTIPDLGAAIKLSPRPVISHETGQFQIYPDYSEIPKYTGVLYPYNLHIFRDRLKENGLTDQIDLFHKSSGQFAVECYKADIEYYLRTPGIGGFQMLDLQDFSGQGTALVGILDAFMDSKGICKPEYFNGFCAPVVPLAKMKTRCWASNETLHVDIALANYEETDWDKAVKWEFVSDDGTWKRSGSVKNTVRQGESQNVGKIKLPLNSIGKATHLTLTLTTGKYRNKYNFWVYPVVDQQPKAPTIATHVDEALKAKLDAGETVLLLPDTAEVKNVTLGPLFTPDYWNYAMFKSISENAKREVSPGTLSLLMDPEHPLFEQFPTDIHSDWQWWAMVHHSRPLILNSTHSYYKPIVQVVDNIERNHKLGLVFEFAVGRGKLLVCMADLDAASKYTEGKAFRTALYNYIQSPQFAPNEYLTWDEMIKLFHGAVNAKDIQGVKNNSDYTTH
jgi:hypothetical protein